MVRSLAELRSPSPELYFQPVQRGEKFGSRRRLFRLQIPKELQHPLTRAAEGLHRVTRALN
jgi:hypothetical protein